MASPRQYYACRASGTRNRSRQQGTIGTDLSAWWWAPLPYWGPDEQSNRSSHKSGISHRWNKGPSNPAAPHHRVRRHVHDLVTAPSPLCLGRVVTLLTATMGQRHGTSSGPAPWRPLKPLDPRRRWRSPLARKRRTAGTRRHLRSLAPKILCPPCFFPATGLYVAHNG